MISINDTPYTVLCSSSISLTGVYSYAANGGIYDCNSAYSYLAYNFVSGQQSWMNLASNALGCNSANQENIISFTESECIHNLGTYSVTVQAGG